VNGSLEPDPPKWILQYGKASGSSHHRRATSARGFRKTAGRFAARACGRPRRTRPPSRPAAPRRGSTPSRSASRRSAAIRRCGPVRATPPSPGARATGRCAPAAVELFMQPRHRHYRTIAVELRLPEHKRQHRDEQVAGGYAEYARVGIARPLQLLDNGRGVILLAALVVRKDTSSVSGRMRQGVWKVRASAAARCSRSFSPGDTLTLARTLRKPRAG